MIFSEIRSSATSDDLLGNRPWRRGAACCARRPEADSRATAPRCGPAGHGCSKQRPYRRRPRCHAPGGVLMLHQESGRRERHLDNCRCSTVRLLDSLPAAESSPRGPRGGRRRGRRSARDRARPPCGDRASPPGRRAPVLPVSAASTVSSWTLMLVCISAASCGGSVPISVGCTPLRSTRHGHLDAARLAGRLAIDARLATLP